MRLRTKVLLALTVVQTVLVLGIVLLHRDNLGDYYEAQMDEYALQLSQAAAASVRNPLLASDAGTVHHTLQQLVQRPHVAYVRIYRDNQVFAGASGGTSTGNHELHEVATPILVGNRTIGKVEIGVSRRFYTERLNRATSQSVSIGALSLLVAWMLAFVLMRGFTDRIVALRQAVQAVAQGKFGWRVEVKGQDEIAETAKAFNLMSANLERVGAERTRARVEIGQIRKEMEVRMNLRNTYSLATRRQLESEMLTDRVTQLPMQLLFRDRIGQAMQRHPERLLAVLLIDIAALRDMSQAIGHGTTDRLLQEMVQRLRATLPDAMLARPGPDELAILLDATESDPGATAERALDALRTTFSLLDSPHVPRLRLTLATSAGCRDAETLLEHAYSMLAGNHTDEIAVYDPTVAGDSRLVPPEELAEAMRNRNLVLTYQPRVDPNDYRLLGLQASLRWDHPARGALAADTFLPLARQTGLCGALTRYALEQALLDRQSGQLGDIGSIPVSIEVDDLSAQEGGFAETVEAMLARTRVPPDTLEIAFTERALTASPAEVSHNIRALKRLGVLIAIEDFGVGYAWLSYLNQEKVQVDTLRIDRSLVHEARLTDANIGLVKAVADFAHRLGIKAVAEGIESDTLLSYVAVFGCDAVSGFHIQKPMTAEELRSWRASGAQPRMG